MADVTDLRVRCFSARVRWLPAAEPALPEPPKGEGHSWGSGGVAYRSRPLRSADEIEEYARACRDLPVLVDDWLGCVRAKGREHFTGHLEVREHSSNPFYGRLRRTAWPGSRGVMVVVPLSRASLSCWRGLRDIRHGGDAHPPPVAAQQILRDLGPLPSEKSPGERALWVAALINPLPALGVALECRPFLLSAEGRRCDECVRAVTRVLRLSIECLRAGEDAVMMNASI